MSRAAQLFQAGRLEDAEAACRQILEAAGQRHFYAWHLLSVIAARRGDPAGCAELATRALEIDPRHVEALCNRGAALRLQGRYEEALADYDRALELAPAHAEALNNRGVALAALNRFDEARACYDRALQLNPRYDTARFNRGLARLVQGDFRGGLPDHEFRWTGSDTQRGARKFAVPQWGGAEPLAGRTILLHAEQGLGDAIMFSRYVPQVADRGARVVLEMFPALAPLLAQLPGIAHIVPYGKAPRDIDLHCPLMSLPLAFGTTVETIPAPVPYLRAPREHLERWSARLGPKRRARVGLAWSGNPALRNDRNRTLALEQLEVLRELPLSFHVLQKDLRPADGEVLGRWTGLAAYGDELEDFRDTAALAELMDVVVSVDTSIAHLAGALARPMWLLLPFSPDWRWLLGREDSPWYPTARLFRQPSPGDWDAVVKDLVEALRRYL